LRRAWLKQKSLLIPERTRSPMQPQGGQFRLKTAYNRMMDKLIGLFPIAFILHDFEELILFEPWLKKNGAAILERIRGKAPKFVERQIEAILHKSTTEFALPVLLIFMLTCIASFLAAEYRQYTFFLIASSLFFLHGFIHLGQALLLRRYIPAVITSLLVVIPYGVFLFWRLLAAGMVSVPELLGYFLSGLVLAVPVIIGMHMAGEFLYQRVVRILIG
jgi:hypothetical protein